MMERRNDGMNEHHNVFINECQFKIHLHFVHSFIFTRPRNEDGPPVIFTRLAETGIPFPGFPERPHLYTHLTIKP